MIEQHGTEADTGADPIPHRDAQRTARFADQQIHFGRGGDTHQIAEGDTPPLTTQQGTPVSDDQNSLKVGERGPTSIEDQHFREKIFHFDHERIPERVVSARGYGALNTQQGNWDIVGNNIPVFFIQGGLHRPERRGVAHRVRRAVPAAAALATRAGRRPDLSRTRPTGPADVTCRPARHRSDST